MDKRMQKKFSIIIPCYNVEGYVSECLDSLLNQTLGRENLEMILVDDCSTDRTVAVLREYEKKYPDTIMLVLLEQNGRQGKARNVGLSYASGEYISFVDADDFVRRDMFEILSELLERQAVDIIQFRYKIFRSAEGIRQDLSEGRQEILDEKNIAFYDYAAKRREYLLNSAILNESCTQKLYSAKLLKEAGVQFAEGVGYEEPLFTYPLKFYCSRVCVLEKPLYFYRENAEGTTLRDMGSAQKILEHMEVQLKLRAFMERLPFMEEYRLEIGLYFLHSFYVEPFYFMKMRGFRLPVRVWRYMKEKVEQYEPAYMENGYLEDASLQDDRILISLMQTVQQEDDKMQSILDKTMEAI